MHLSFAVWVILALVILAAHWQLVNIANTNNHTSNSREISLLSSTSSISLVLITSVVCLFGLTIAWFRAFLSFGATLDDRNLTIHHRRIDYALNKLITLFEQFWRRLWLFLSVGATIGMFWPTQILRLVCDCSAPAHRAVGSQESIRRLLCYRIPFANLYRCKTHLIFVSISRLVSLRTVAFVVLGVILTYAVVTTYTISAVHAPRKAIPSVARHVSAIHSSSDPRSSSLELLPEISVCRLPIPIISAHELSSQFPKDYLIHPDFITKYELGAELGAGGNGFVLQARRRADGQQVAVKLSRKPNYRSSRWSEHPTYGYVNNDVLVMDMARHENIIALLDVFSDDIYLYIVQELYGTLSYINDEEENRYSKEKWPNGSRCLYSHIRANGLMSPNQAVYVFYQLVDAVAHLHSLGISHCDVKPGNILIDATTFKIKLIDFGNVLRIPEGCDPDEVRCFRNDPRRFLGTEMFTPPEIHNSETYEAYAADVWAMGLVLCFMLLGHLPFSTDNVDSIKSGKIGCHPQCYNVLQPVWFIVSSCLKMEFLLRPSAPELQLRERYIPLALERHKLMSMSREELWEMMGHVPLPKINIAVKN